MLFGYSCISVVASAFCVGDDIEHFCFSFCLPSVCLLWRMWGVAFAGMCCVEIQSKLKLLWASPSLCALCKAGFGVNAPLLICSVVNVSLQRGSHCQPPGD